jgi:hypothetical protein
MAHALRSSDEMAKSKRTADVQVRRSADPPGVGADRARVERRAYELYVLRGRTDGHDQDDWFMAEHELTVGASLPEDEPDGAS